MADETTRDMPQRIATSIYVVRGQRVMLDEDLAAAYSVTTKRLNEQLRRNPARFPGDFAFELTSEELANLRSQFAISNGSGWGSLTVNLETTRPFGRLREMAITQTRLAHELEKLRRRCCLNSSPDRPTLLAKPTAIQ